MNTPQKINIKLGSPLSRSLNLSVVVGPGPEPRMRLGGCPDQGFGLDEGRIRVGFCGSHPGLWPGPGEGFGEPPWGIV